VGVVQVVVAVEVTMLMRKSRKVVLKKFASRKAASRHPKARLNNTFDTTSTMADYKKYLASGILTEDKVVCYCLETDSWKV
jgi:hypothetical protein